MHKLLSVLLLAVVCSLCAAQVNFTPNWGKRGLVPVAEGCKAPLESLMYIYKLLQSEAQKMIDCERIGNI